MKGSFNRLEEKLKSQAPASISEANELAEAVVDPATSTADQCWEVLWDKPLYANANEASVRVKVEKSRALLVNAWRQIGVDTDLYYVSRKMDTSLKKTIAATNYDLSGTLATQLRSAPFNFPPHRLLAIQGAAIALQNRTRKNGKLPFRDLAEPPSVATLLGLKKEFGVGWGHITVLHFLTDLGVGCKPDRHLVRTLHHVGYPVHDFGDRIPTPEEAIEIVVAIRKLTTDVRGSSSPQNFRYVDKVLMEISRQLFRTASSKPTRKVPRSGSAA